MPLEGHFLSVIISKSFMLTHEGHVTPVPHSMGEELQDVYFSQPHFSNDTSAVVLNDSTNK